MYSASIKLEPDAHGMLARACPDDSCTPGYFKVKPGTGLAGAAVTHCPYCGKAEKPTAFPSKAQVEYGKALLVEEAKEGVAQMLSEALGLGASGRKRMGGGLISMTMELKKAPRRPVPRPVEEELRRDLTCPHCGLFHAVFGLASICPDCGRNILMAHVREELGVVGKILDAVPGRQETLGARVAGRDLENALEDVVSIFEAAMKFITRRALAGRGMTEPDVNDILTKRVRNDYQNVDKAERLFQELFQAALFDCLSASERKDLSDTFEKRHPITHNLGIVDRKYLQRAAASALEGREVRVTAEEIRAAIARVDCVIDRACQDLLGTTAFPATAASQPVAAAQPTAGAHPEDLAQLSVSAMALAEYLVKRSELGHERDPTVPLSDLVGLLPFTKDELLRAARELASIEALWIHEPIPNSQDEIGPLNRLFELGDRIWMGWDVSEDACALATDTLARGILIVPEEAQRRGWSARRMNPALEFIIGRGWVEGGPYAHPFVAYRIEPNERTASEVSAGASARRR